MTLVAFAVTLSQKSVARPLVVPNVLLSFVGRVCSDMF